MGEWLLCNAHAHLAQWEKAIEWCEKSVADNPAFFQPYFELAAAYASLGREADAHAAVSRLQAIKPGSSVRTYLDVKYSENPTWKNEEQRIAEGLRKAGLPEGRNSQTPKLKCCAGRNVIALCSSAVRSLSTFVPYVLNNPMS